VETRSITTHSASQTVLDAKIGVCRPGQYQSY